MGARRRRGVKRLGAGVQTTIGVPVLCCCFSTGVSILLSGRALVYFLSPRLSVMPTQVSAESSLYTPMPSEREGGPAWRSRVRWGRRRWAGCWERLCRLHTDKLDAIHGPGGHVSLEKENYFGGF